MNPSSDPQLAALGWMIFGALVACIAAIVVLLRSGRTVPPLGGVSIGGSGPGAEGGHAPDEARPRFRARRR